MGILKNLRFDLLGYTNFKIISAGFLGSLVAAFVIQPLFAIGLFFIGGLLLLGGEWFAREIYRRPIPETYKSVIIGWLITGAGISMAHLWIIFCGVWPVLHAGVWLWAVILTGGPMINWQRRKLREQNERNNEAIKKLGRKFLYEDK